MIYGLCGSSGSGKTTLATMVAEAMNLTFLKTSITESAKRHGFDPVARLSLEERINLQFWLIADMIEAMENAEKPVIMDRTPIDMIAYMLCEFHMHSHTEVRPDLLPRVNEYVELCLAVTRRMFDHLFLLCPLEHYEVVATRPAANPAYNLHTQVVMQGALNMISSQINHSIMNTTDQDMRLAHLTDVIERRLNDLEKERISARHIH